MAWQSSNRRINFFIMGVSDLMFVLLFFFILSGKGKPHEAVPYMPGISKNTQLQAKPKAVTVFKIKIPRIDSELQSSAIEFECDGPSSRSDTVEYPNSLLREAHLNDSIAADLQRFVDLSADSEETISVKIYSDTESLYGFTAAFIAACESLRFESYLMFRTEETT